MINMVDDEDKMGEEPMDDLESDFSGGEDSFDAFTKVEKGSLAELWQENPALRIGAIALGAVAILGTIILFGGEEETAKVSRVGTSSEVTAPPGTEGASEAYIQAVEDETEARIEEAQKTGGSALPTPVDPPIGRVTLPPEDEVEEDPLQRWRRLQEERLERELEVRETVEPIEVEEDNSYEEAVGLYQNYFLQEMQNIMQMDRSVPTNYVQMTSPDWLASLNGAETGSAGTGVEGGAVGPDGKEAVPEVVAEVLQPAGEIEYAQLITEANSDTPGPVLAYVASGPLKGGRLIGQFDVKGDRLVLSFTTIVLDGVSYTANAVALDPETTLPGMATEVDHRYIQRVLLPTAAAFIEGLTDAISESGSTTVTINGETVTSSTEDKDNDEEVASGIAEAGSEISDILDDMADNVETLVRIDKGTPIGVLFLEPVVKEAQ